MLYYDRIVDSCFLVGAIVGGHYQVVARAKRGKSMRNVDFKACFFYVL